MSDQLVALFLVSLDLREDGKHIVNFLSGFFSNLICILIDYSKASLTVTYCLKRTSGSSCIIGGVEIISVAGTYLSCEINTCKSRLI